MLCYRELPAPAPLKELGFGIYRGQLDGDALRAARRCRTVACAVAAYGCASFLFAASGRADLLMDLPRPVQFLVLLSSFLSMYAFPFAMALAHEFIVDVRRERRDLAAMKGRFDAFDDWDARARAFNGRLKEYDRLDEAGRREMHARRESLANERSALSEALR